MEHWHRKDKSNQLWSQHENGDGAPVPHPLRLYPLPFERPLLRQQRSQCRYKTLMLPHLLYFTGGEASQTPAACLYPFVPDRGQLATTWSSVLS